MSSSGIFSAWSLSKIFCMKPKYCSLMVGFLCKVRAVDLRRFIAFSRLLGRSLRSQRRGRGASQLPFLSFTIPFSIIVINLLSSAEVPGLLSSCVRTNTVRPKPSSNGLSIRGVASCPSHDVGLVSCLRWKRFGQGRNADGRPL